MCRSSSSHTRAACPHTHIYLHFHLLVLLTFYAHIALSVTAMCISVSLTSAFVPLSGAHLPSHKRTHGITSFALLAHLLLSQAHVAPLFLPGSSAAIYTCRQATTRMTSAGYARIISESTWDCLLFASLSLVVFCCVHVWICFSLAHSSMHFCTGLLAYSPRHDIASSSSIVPLFLSFYSSSWSVSCVRLRLRLLAMCKARESLRFVHTPPPFISFTSVLSLCDPYILLIIFLWNSGLEKAGTIVFSSLSCFSPLCPVLRPCCHSRFVFSPATVQACIPLCSNRA